MTPQKALELVHQYSEYNKAIKDATIKIGQHLSSCNGINGKRKDPMEPSNLDEKNRDLNLHLTDWYGFRRGDNYGGGYYEDVTEEEHGEECPHCYAAHLLIEKRKELRKQFAIVKRSMSRV